MFSLFVLSNLALPVLTESQTLRSCDLGSSYGRASSNLGRFESKNSIGLSCSYRAGVWGPWGLSIAAKARENAASVSKSQGDALDLRSFQYRDFALGIKADARLSQEWGVYASLFRSQGKGTLDKSYSTPSLRQSLDHAKLNARSWQEEVGLSFHFNQDLSLLTGAVLSQENWAWNPDEASFLGESVSPDKRLSLNSNPQTWQGSVDSGTVKAQVAEIKIAIQLGF